MVRTDDGVLWIREASFKGEAGTGVANLESMLGVRAGKRRVKSRFCDIYTNRQVVIIVVLLTLSTHQKSRSPSTASDDQWHACGRPLGVWNCIWIVRIFLACGLSYWGWCRDRKMCVNIFTIIN